MNDEMIESGEVFPCINRQSNIGVSRPIPPFVKPFGWLIVALNTLYNVVVVAAYKPAL